LRFILGQPTTLAITINDADYLFPKFLGDAFDEHTAKYAAKVMDEALAEFDAKDREGRARFRAIWRTMPLDVNEVTADLKTAKGCDIVIRWCGEHANPVVPADVLTQFIKEIPVPFKRQLAGVLLGTELFEKAMKDDSGEKDQPDDGAPPLTESGGPTPPQQPASEGASTPTT
jgi:hypothetical protein